MSSCTWLQWKLSTDDRRGGTEADAFARNMTPYSCLETCEPWGPDGDLAAPELCHSGRSCHQFPADAAKRSGSGIA